VFTHAADPLDADDWLKTVSKMLTTAQCDDRDKVLFAAGRLQGSAGAWWDAYTTAHATPNAITWQEFTKTFRNHHIPAGLMRLKKKEFLSLQQGGMSVTEYRDRFIELSLYAPEEVANDPKKQERFMEGLAGPLRYQLTSHTFQSFQHLLDKAITLEAMRIELRDLKRKATTSLQFGSSTRPRFIPPQGTTPQVGGSGGNSGQKQFQRNNQPFKHPIQELQHSTPQTPCPNDQQTSQNTPAGTPVRPSVPSTLVGKTCFKCGETGHYANKCPQRSVPNTPVQSQQMRNGNRTPQSAKGQQSSARDRLNHINATTVLGMFSINIVLISVLPYRSRNHYLSFRISRTRFILRGVGFVTP
jgi:hypothetical protein